MKTVKIITELDQEMVDRAFDEAMRQAIKQFVDEKEMESESRDTQE